MFELSLFDEITPRSSREDDKRLSEKLSTKRVSSPSGNTIRDKIEIIKMEVERQLSFLYGKVSECRSEEELSAYIDRMIASDLCSVDTETLGTNYFKDKIFGFSLSADGTDAVYVPILHKGYVTGGLLDRQLTREQVSRQLNRLAASKTKIVMHNAKFDIHMVYHNFGVKLKCYWDTMIASRLIHSAERDHSLKYQYNVKVRGESGKPYDFKSLFGGVPAEMVPVATMTPYAAGDTFETIGLAKYQMEEFKKYPGIYNTFKLEMKVLEMIVDMEETGVCIDREALKEMSDKYTSRLSAAANDCYKELEKYQDKINRYRIQHPGKLGSPINLSSSSQIAIIIYDIIGLAELPKYKRGTGKEVLKVFKEKNAFCKRLSDYRDSEKLVNGFINSIPTFIMSDNKVHSDFVQVKGTGNTTEEDDESGADTGRFSCIAEGQYVQVVNGQKKIEDVEVGDYVYCYDDSGNIRLSKVKNKYNNGFRECVKIVWQSTGSHNSGSLICTPDHRIRRKDGKWIQAKDLKRFDKLTHMRRGTGEDGRPRVYGTNSFMDLEHNIIKRDYFKCSDSRMCIHHKDKNKSNNSLDNLELKTLSEHTRQHTEELLREGKINTKEFRSEKYRPKQLKSMQESTLKKISKEQTIKLLLENGGSPTKCGYDYSTIMRRVREYGIDLQEISDICRGLDRENFTKVFFEEKGLSTKIAARLHIGFDTSNKYIKKYNLCYNHMVQSVTDAGIFQVYDLEVETYHNFIVSEICVHNCKDPNLQQIPSHGEKTELRKIFCATKDSEEFIDSDENDYFEIYINNRVQTRNGWKTAKEIKVGDELVCKEDEKEVYKVVKEFEIKDSERLCYVLF